MSSSRPRAASTHSQDDQDINNTATMRPKLSRIEASPDGRCATFVLRDEDHTLGNVLRDLAMTNSDVAMAAYNVPHPLERDLHVRIETKNKPVKVTANTALRKACRDLVDQCVHVEKLFDAALSTTENDDDVEMTE